MICQSCGEAIPNVNGRQKYCTACYHARNQNAAMQRARTRGVRDSAQHYTVWMKEYLRNDWHSEEGRRYQTRDYL